MAMLRLDLLASPVALATDRSEKGAMACACRHVYDGPMPPQYISSKSTYFHPTANATDYDFVLIFGDEVDTTATAQSNGRREVI
jgi:hypothetical protein